MSFLFNVFHSELLSAQVPMAYAEDADVLHVVGHRRKDNAQGYGLALHVLYVEVLLPSIGGYRSTGTVVHTVLHIHNAGIVMAAQMINFVVAFGRSHTDQVCSLSRAPDVVAVVSDALRSVEGKRRSRTWKQSEKLQNMAVSPKDPDRYICRWTALHTGI